MDRSRVVEIYHAGTGSHGSGYLVTRDAILTACHVAVPEAAPPAGPHSFRYLDPSPGGSLTWYRADLAWHDRVRDLAVLKARRATCKNRAIAPFGAIDGDAPIPCRVVGFPQARDDGSEASHPADVHGLILPLEGARDGFYSIDVTSATPGDPDHWKGISGAPAFCGELLAGVVESYSTRFVGKKLAIQPVSSFASDPEFLKALGVSAAETRPQPILAPGRRLRPAARAQLTRLLTEDLTRLLQKLAISQGILFAVYRQLTGSSEPATGDLADLIRALDASVPQTGTSLTNPELYALRLANMCELLAKRASSAEESRELAKARSSLERWIARFPAKSSGPAVVAERFRLAAAANATDALSAVVLDLSGNPDAGEARGWCYSDGAVVDACHFSARGATMKERLTDALNAVYDAAWLVGDTVIELVLPLSQVFENYGGIEIDTLPGVVQRLGRRPYFMVVRVAERWCDRVWRLGWERRWAAITNQLHGGAPALTWVEAGRPCMHGDFRWLGINNRNDHHLLDALKMELHGGAPFAVWCEPALAHAVAQALCAYTYVQRLDLLVALDTLAGAGGSITCLVDEPVRLPPGADPTGNPLRQPGMRAPS